VVPASVLISIPARLPVQSSIACQVGWSTVGAGVSFGGGGTDREAGELVPWRGGPI
jgi:hypothetical protein